MAVPLRPHLLMSVQIGPISLKHRIVMEPLTGSRSEQPGEIPGALMLEYYAQRASDGGWRRLRDRSRTQKGDHLLAKRAAAAVKPVLVIHRDTAIGRDAPRLEVTVQPAF